MKPRRKYFLFLSIFLQIVKVKLQFYNQQPCSGYWSYRIDINGRFGLVTLPNPNPNQNVVKVKLMLPVQLSSNYFGEIDLLKDKTSSANDVRNGFPLYFRVEYPIQDPLPSPVEIYANGQLLCSGPKVTASYVTTITLDYTFLTGYSASAETPLSHPPPRPMSPPVPQPLPSPPTPPISIENTVSVSRVALDFPPVINGFECGEPDYQPPTAKGLVIGGYTAARAQFPWLAAYYHNGFHGDTGFICGGSVISKKLIVTAAHCIQNKEDHRRKAEEASFFIGKHNLEDLRIEQHYIVSGVIEFVIHPDWNYLSTNYDADVAIAILTRTLPISKFIKPICLPVNESSYKDMVGQNGVLAGWGKTEFKAVSTEEPKWTFIPVVDSLECLRSNGAFSQLTSNRTFCAGDRTGKTGPCYGDSGGGFMINRKKKWYLRGVISSAIQDQVLSTCDIKSYAVFTDVAAFTEWLQSYIQSYG